MARVARAVVLVSFGVLAACRSGPPCALDDPAKDEVDDRKHMLRDRNAARAGKPTCPTYFPVTHVALTSDVLELTSHKRDPYVMKRSDISAGTIARIDYLEASLKNVSGYWKIVHSGEAPPGRVAIELDPALETARAASVIGTAGLAGFPHEEVRAGATTFGGLYTVPAPPDARASQTPAVLVVDASSAPIALRFQGAACARAGATAPTASGVPGAIASACAGAQPCADEVVFVVDEAAPFSETAALVAGALGAAPFTTRPLSFAFRGAKTPAPPSEHACAK